MHLCFWAWFANFDNKSSVQKLLCVSWCKSFHYNVSIITGPVARKLDRTWQCVTNFFYYSTQCPGPEPHEEGGRGAMGVPGLRPPIYAHHQHAEPHRSAPPPHSRLQLSDLRQVLQDQERAQHPQAQAQVCHLLKVTLITCRNIYIVLELFFFIFLALSVLSNSLVCVELQWKFIWFSKLLTVMPLKLLENVKPRKKNALSDWNVFLFGTTAVKLLEILCWKKKRNSLRTPTRLLKG